MAYYCAEAAVEAVREFLEDGLDANASATTYNEEVAAMRAGKSLSDAQLPNIAQFETYYPREFQSRQFPHVSIIYLSDGSEVERNSRMVDVEIEVRLTVLDQNVAGSEVQVGQAMARYRDALVKMFLRRSDGAQGWTLNNGGSGDAQGRVILSRITNNALTFDPELQASTANMLLRTGLTVRIQEDY